MERKRDDHRILSWRADRRRSGNNLEKLKNMQI